MRVRAEFWSLAGGDQAMLHPLDFRRESVFLQTCFLQNVVCEMSA